MSTTLVLVRHGEIIRPADTSNFDRAPLSDRGEAEVKSLARAWPADRPAVVLTSPLRRCIESAIILGASFGLPIRKRRCLTEWTADSSGIPQAEYKALEQRAWADLNFIPASKESLAQAAIRGRQCLDDVAKEARDTTVAVMGHGTLFSLVTAALQGERPTEVYKNSIRFAAAAIVDASSDLRLVRDFQVYSSVPE